MQENGLAHITHLCVVFDVVALTSKSSQGSKKLNQEGTEGKVREPIRYQACRRASQQRAPRD